MKNALTLLTLAMIPHATQAAALAPIRFGSFEYTGTDAVFENDLPPQSYRNPIIAGTSPDPSILRVGEWNYLVTSTFSWFPGLPVYRSRDLVNWEHLGYAIDRPGMVDMSGRGVSESLFAPTIKYHDGLFYIANTAVNCGGNFFITAKDPAGPWSDPVWLPGLEDGIDPSFFFDDDGKAWLINNGNPPDNKPLYEGHRAIWLQEFDVAAQKLVGPRTIIINGGTDLSQKPIWIEGPNIFKKDGLYYLCCAEGGTAEDHRQVIFRAKDIHGPWEPWEHNPILTQRDLDPARPNPVTCAGHAAFVDMGEAGWWATFLACRPYKDGLLYNTGRETFLLPVSWLDGWPMILPAGQPIPSIVAAPQLLGAGVADQAPWSGNFTVRDEFGGPALNLMWQRLRTSSVQWANLKDGALELQPRPERIEGREQPSFLARRQQHQEFTCTLALEPPQSDGVSAGLVAFQNEDHSYFIGVRREGSDLFLFLEKADGGAPRVVAGMPLVLDGEGLHLRIVGAGAIYSFQWSTDGDAWRTLADEDGTILHSVLPRDFVGTHLGPYARLD